MKRIAFLTDIHLDEQFPIDHDVNPVKNLEVVLADLTKEKITQIVFGGDIGEATSHQYFFETLKEFSLSLIIGNHDKFEQVKVYFNKSNDENELYYKIDEAHYQYLFLDTSSDSISENQLQWLRSVLDDTKDIVLFIHHPVLEIITPVDKLYPLKNRELLTAILHEHTRTVTIFCGHYHMNDEQQQQRIRQITTQSLSFQLVKNETEIKVDNSIFGYRIIEIDDNKIETQVINFTYNKQNEQREKSS